MSVTFGPPVPPDATAVRPDWSALPRDVRLSGVEAHLGAPVTGVRPMRGGFTNAFAAVVTAANGDTAFVKAVSGVDNPVIARSFQREAQINEALPDPVPAPRIRWQAAVGEWTVLGFEAVPGRMPAMPWRPADLTLALDTWASAAAALTPAPAAMLAVGLEPIADDIGPAFGSWRYMAAGELVVPTMPPYAAGKLNLLATLEADWTQACVGDTAIHCDLRLDNVLIGDTGSTAWICDWNWPCVAAPWVDTVTLLITAYASHFDADALFSSHPTARGVAPEQLDALLAALAGYYLSRGMEPDAGLASPHLRQHQWWSGQVALAWLAERRQWR